ncbi:MAG: fructose bisphosphate aldolase [Sphaerochaetaceae bacterium]|nr:fructose bisphosphate aldolase [Sphaerochaetaceae bacterium]
MNLKQLDRMKNGKGFIAALDNSGGSTPKALEQYGIKSGSFKNDEQMFALMHEMRSRIITSPSFTKEHIIAAILFQDTLDRTIEGLRPAQYLWEKKGIVPFLKADKGLAPVEDGVQLMKPFPELKTLLERATEHEIFGTKMRSVIKEANAKSIRKVVQQQFDTAQIILGYDLVPIIEPEVDIFSPDKIESEKILKEELLRQLSLLDDETKVMFKLSIPTKAGFYTDLINDEHVVRVVALSGGYDQDEANTLLVKNKGLIASFSRALAQNLHITQSDEQFNQVLASSISRIYEASIS